MEAKKEEFIVTQEWLEEMGACVDELQAFEKYFPNGGEALEVLERCVELNDIYFGTWLISLLPLTYPPLELNTFVGNLLYPGDVHIKGDISTQGVIRIKGNLKVDGKLTVNKHLDVCSAKGCVNADEIYISGEASIYAQVKANSIIMSDHALIGGDTVANSIRLRSALIFGNTEAKVINVKGSQIRGFVDADEIINDGGLIYGDVNTIKIENINGGIVDGYIFYESPDEHK
ncbi:hypothetical protein BHC47_11360 [Snodgrassella alvi]|uniref:Polymer-forming cytoskeletal protein n=1 Tax=Snodgrassella alvi TaxID=1196083 RepID=A0A2N9Y4N3_9NEIS|nr:polymer-forming cytoskeletal protein [Snodgrassella alvi]PIT62960.1 hypothetical protein BHC47_11360 [Snodgrassella alvi]PIT67074.1 hypothetical protein BHC56_09235 [Snodgrassella alvi]